VSEPRPRIPPPGLRVAITGSSGLVGSTLVAKLRGAGHEITRLVRQPEERQPGIRLALWNPARERLPGDALEGHDVVIHLAGAGLDGGRWSASRKEEIRTSRVAGTALLCRTLAGLGQPPAVLLSASAVGYYGARPATEAVDESGPPGQGFLAGVCHRWEQATRPAEEAGIRVVKLRLGLVLSTAGGALGRMLPIFRRGLGGRLGSGRQVVSWIALREVPAIVQHLIAARDVSGPVNVVTPKAVSNAKLTRELCAAVGTSEKLPVPAFALKLRFGREMAEELLLSGAWVVPRRLLESGYRFRHPKLADALRTLLGGGSGR